MTESISPQSSNPIWYKFIQEIYDSLIVDKLPRSFHVYNGVTVRNGGFLDRQIRFSNFKEGLINAIHEEVEQGDKVVSVALGPGVSAVHVIRAGAESLISFEGAEEMIELAKETLEVNLTKDQAAKVTIRHAIVGEAVSLWGESRGNVVEPEDLPSADVLLLDCEGAESGILEGLEARPRTIICESHPAKDSPTEAITKQLKEMGYDTKTRPYESGWSEQKQVVVGHRSD